MGQVATCVVCRRREPSRGHVCEPCRDSLAELLTDLPRKVAALTLQLVPGPAALGERVSTSRVGSPIPIRLDALSLSGPGRDGVTGALHPLVRRWSTVHTVTVTTTGAAGPRTEERQVTEWHQELTLDADGKPVMVADDDQIGALPPAEWLASWTRMWREHFGLHTPKPVTARPRPARWRELDAVARQALAAKLLGIARNGPRTDDPLADEWEVRFGEPPREDQPAADVSFLLLWLDDACDQDVGVGELAAELRALSAELTRVLGENPDQQWLGRCPAQVTDHREPDDPGHEDATQRRAVTRPCGAGLWQDPHASQVQCPRCHSTWGPRKVELLYLAKEIRRVWPIDRRRRYHGGEIDALRTLRCPACGDAVMVSWRNVTATTDERLWWRPDRVMCPTGCPEAERLA